MPRESLDALAALVIVAEERSFAKAARRLAVSPSAVSHTIRALEARIGVRLLSRTTRSVAPTEAGRLLLEGVRPPIEDIERTVERVKGLRGVPTGRIRLLAPRLAARMVLGPKLAAFAARCPDVVLDVTTDDSLLDLVAGQFDAGIHLGEFIAWDMVAVRVSLDLRAAIVGAPSYFAAHPPPNSPRDLPAHRCINIRLGAEGIYRWEFERDGQALKVTVDGPLDTDDLELSIRAALDGVGLAYSFEDHVASHLAAGTLVRVLADWCPPFPGFFLYYPSRRQMPASLAALVDTLRYR